jgi:hypothetical protein
VKLFIYADNMPLLSTNSADIKVVFNSISNWGRENGRVSNRSKIKVMKSFVFCHVIMVLTLQGNLVLPSSW